VPAKRLDEAMAALGVTIDDRMLIGSKD